MMFIDIKSIATLHIHSNDYRCIFVVITKKVIRKGYKYFIGYKDDEKVKLLCIMLPKMSVRVAS